MSKRQLMIFLMKIDQKEKESSTEHLKLLMISIQKLLTKLIVKINLEILVKSLKMHLKPILMMLREKVEKLLIEHRVQPKT